MAETHAQFTGSIPELYDRHLGPVIFEPYALDLARRVAARATGPVLETACGTGILTRQLRTQLPPSIHLTATDLNQPMIDYARAKLGESAQVAWQQADAAALPFPTASFAAVACQFGLMFVPDKPAAFREARRVLKDGGVFAFNVWDSLAHNPYARITHETIGKFFPNNPPTFFQVPFGFYDFDVLRNLLTAHGFDQIEIAQVQLEAHSSSAESLAVGFVKGSPVSNAIQERGGSFDDIVAAVAAALAHEGGDRPFRSTMQAVIVTARAKIA